MIRIDMHVHSTASDGTCTPAEIARLARRDRVSVLALTDHDTVDGISGFIAACKRCAVRWIAGIELSAAAKVTTHILGYRLRNLDMVKRAMDWVVEKRNERNRLMCEKLRTLDIDIDLKEIEREAGGHVIARPHFAGVMLKKGYVSDYREAFDRYLARGAVAYVPREAYSPEACISLIREAGGVAALAHPSQTGLSDSALDDLLLELKGYGLWGLECISSHCTSEQAFDYMRIADKHALCATGGSDFHGARRPGVAMGVQVSEDFLPWARLGVTL
ncbi:PHP domain-containing protein [Synergistaceae bacterium OttesenSCG-928-I11]|nr:PHP domain-containing protein [Synergistaceae bacterium OttesenSCG-928-I11]